MKLRILAIADCEPDPDSGAAGTNYQGVMALRRAGHHVVDIWGDALPRRIDHYNLRYLLELPAAYAALVKRELRSAKYDVVQISQPHGYAAARQLRKSYPDTVFVHRSHGFEPRVEEALVPWRSCYHDNRSRVRRLASALMAEALQFNNWAIARWAHGHIVGARDCANFLVERYGVSRSAIAVIPQGLPNACLAPIIKPSAERLRRLLYVGQFAFVKGPMILADAISFAMRSDPSLTFTWVCARKHHPEALALMTPEVRSRVQMLDWMPQEELRKVYDSHGIFVFPSFFEGFGKALIEAMSRGLVSIASDAVAAADLIENGRNGWRVPVGNSDAISSCISESVANPERSLAIAEAAAKDASLLTWENYAESAAAFFEDLLRERRSRVQEYQRV